MTLSWIDVPFPYDEYTLIYVSHECRFPRPSSRAVCHDGTVTTMGRSRAFEQFFFFLIWEKRERGARKTAYHLSNDVRLFFEILRLERSEEEGGGV
jgi:hypothetical protein